MGATDSTTLATGYSIVNGMRMYYEVHGQGKPLVLIHGGGSTIQTSFGRIIPLLAKRRQVIGVELQAHGRTQDRDQPLSFTQDADDVAGLLKNLQFGKADILGFSNGGQTTMEIAMRHPDRVNKLIICSVFYKRNGVFPGFWDGFQGEVPFSNMPQVYKDEFLKVNDNRDALLNMFNRDVERMRAFKDWSDEQIRGIKAPALVVNGNADVGTIEHTVELYRLLPNAELAILPGAHGQYLGEIASAGKYFSERNMIVPIIEDFLDKA